MRGHVRGGGQLADRAVCAELEIVALLAELDQLDVCQPEFERLLGAFTQAAREHFDFEERQVWPRLRSALTAKAADELGLKVLAARQAVPVPPSRGVGLVQLRGLLYRESAACFQLSIRFVVLTGRAIPDAQT